MAAERCCCTQPCALLLFSLGSAMQDAPSAGGSRNDPGADPRTLGGCCGHTSAPACAAFLSGALSNSASPFTRTLALDRHLSQGRCRKRHLSQSLKGQTHLVIKETGQSDQENLKDTGFKEANLVLKEMQIKTYRLSQIYFSPRDGDT